MAVKIWKRRLPGGGVSLYLDINYHGRRYKEALGFRLEGDRLQNRETMKMAEEIRARREIDLQSQIHGIVLGNRLRQNFFEYCDKLIEARNSPRLASSWGNALTHLKRSAGEDLTFGQMNRDLFERYKSYLLQKLSNNAAQMYYARIKTILHQAVRDGIIQVNPATLVSPIRKEEKLPGFLTLKEVQILAQTPCPNHSVKAAFLFSCFSGLRYSDAKALTWDRIVDGYLEFQQRKTGVAERLPLSSQALDILERQKAAAKNETVRKEYPDNIVFFLPRHSTVYKELNTWAKAAGLNKIVSFHKARHTFATLALSSGVDIYTTSKLLGHKCLQTTQIYAKVIDEKKREAVSLLPRIVF